VSRRARRRMVGFLHELKGYGINHKIIILKESPPSIMMTKKFNGMREYE
jgi:hypothetical protein